MQMTNCSFASSMWRSRRRIRSCWSWLSRLAHRRAVTFAISAWYSLNITQSLFQYVKRSLYSLSIRRRAVLLTLRNALEGICKLLTNLRRQQLLLKLLLYLHLLAAGFLPLLGLIFGNQHVFQIAH